LRFTVRRPANAEVSPCCHRPSGGDFACSVHVGGGGSRGAVVALEHRLALAAFGRDFPARGASLRRVRGRDLLDPTMSLVLQPRGEQTLLAPLCSRKRPVSRHPGNVTATTDKSPKGEAAFAPPAEVRGYYAASIR
jgi:hypothetical protein